MVDLSKERKCRNFAKQLDRLRIIADIGCPDLYVESTTVYLRDIEQNFTKFWRISGFTTIPTIRAFVWIKDMLNPDETAIHWGNANEIPTSGEVIKANMLTQGVNIPDNYIIMDGEIGRCYDFYTNNSDRDLTIGEFIPYIEGEMKIAKFFHDPIIYWQGICISRLDVIKHASYALGIIHTDETDYERKNSQKCAILNVIYDSPIVLKRNNIIYILLSIARNIIEAECTKQYLRKFGY